MKISGNDWMEKQRAIAQRLFVKLFEMCWVMSRNGSIMPVLFMPLKA